MKEKVELSRNAKIKKGEASIDIAKALMIAPFIMLFRISPEEIWIKIPIIIISWATAIFFLNFGINLINESEKK